MSALIGALRVTLGLDSAAFEKGVGNAQNKMGRLTGGLTTAAGLMASAFAAIGLTNLIGQAFDMASALSEDAEKLGLTAEALQEMRFAAKQSGIEQDTLARAFMRLNQSLGDLQMGKKNIVEMFAAIGLSAADLKDKSPDQALRLIADGLNKLPDPAQRVAIGMQLMGRNFSELLPLLNGGSKAIDEFANKQKAMGEVSTENAKKLDDLADRWDAYKTQLLTIVANLLPPVLNFFESIGVALDLVQDHFAKVHDSWVNLFTSIISGAERMYVGVKTWLQDKIGAVIQWFADKLDWLTKKAESLGSGFSAGTGKMHASLLTFAGDGALQLASFGDAAEAVSVRVQESFKDMAQGVLDAFAKLSSSIKSGGFLDILGAVVGLGLQLGSAGLFGGTIAGRINNPAGTGSVPSVRGGGGGSFGGVGRGGITTASTTVQVVPSPYFNVVVDHRIGSAAPAIAMAGANGGVQKMQYTGSRRVA